MPETSPKPAEGPAEDSAFGWKRAAEFLKNILRLERSVTRLEEENERLRQRVEELQRAVDDHNGQLKAILSTLNSVIDHSVEARAERIAIDTVVRLLDKKIDR